MIPKLLLLADSGPYRLLRSEPANYGSKLMCLQLAAAVMIAVSGVLAGCRFWLSPLKDMTVTHSTCCWFVQGADSVADFHTGLLLRL